MRNYTHFGTYLDAEGRPSWSAALLDEGGNLTFRESKWYHGETAKIEFRFEGSDTLATYYDFYSEEFEEPEVGPTRLYQLVLSFRKEDTDIPDTWIYQLYYFPSIYRVEPIGEKAYSITLGKSGEVVGMDGEEIQPDHWQLLAAV